MNPEIVDLLRMSKLVKNSTLVCRYRNAGLNASCRVYEVLRSLAEDLKGSLNSIVFISVLAVIAKSLFAHVRWGF